MKDKISFYRATHDIVNKELEEFTIKQIGDMPYYHINFYSKTEHSGSLINIVVSKAQLNKIIDGLIEFKNMAQR